MKNPTPTIISKNRGGFGDFGNKNHGGFTDFGDKNRGGFYFFEAFLLYIRKKAVILQPFLRGLSYGTDF